MALKLQIQKFISYLHLFFNWKSAVVAGWAVAALVAILFAGDAMLYLSDDSEDMEHVSAVIRNYFLIVAGVAAFVFAIIRIQLTDEQVALARDDGLRKDRERVEERLEGAVRLLAEPTDSMKRFAITQLAQIGLEHPEQTLESAVRCLCSHAKEYEPFFPTSLTDSMRGEAARAGTAHFREMTGRPFYEFTTVEDQIEAFFQQARQPQIDQRTIEIIKASIEVINGLEGEAIHVRREGMATANNAQLAVRAPIDLQGVTITGVTLYSLGIYVDRFQGCVFERVDFEECDFRGTFNRMTKFLSCRFFNCTFGDVIFSESEFTASTFFATEISRHSAFLFSNCDMSGTDFQFNEAGIHSVHIDEADPDWRLNYIRRDFQGCYVEAQSSLPQGLDANSPPLRIRPRDGPGDRTFISVVPAETDQNGE